MVASGWRREFVLSFANDGRFGVEVSHLTFLSRGPISPGTRGVLGVALLTHPAAQSFRSLGGEANEMFVVVVVVLLRRNGVVVPFQTRLV